MPFEIDPIEGTWYQHLDKGAKFEVLAVDEDTGVVEIQYFDGNVEEIGLDSWYDLDVEPIEPPEDWTGPIDDVERDDLGYTETDMESEDWAGSLEDWPKEEWPKKRETWQKEGEEERGEETKGPEEPWKERE